MPPQNLVGFGWEGEVAGKREAVKCTTAVHVDIKGSLPLACYASKGSKRKYNVSS